MDEKTAWSNFCMTGKAEDYIKYAQLKNSTIIDAVATNSSLNYTAVSALREPDANKDGRNNNKRTNDR